jgi:serine/threonine-protein kinase
MTLAEQATPVEPSTARQSASAPGAAPAAAAASPPSGSSVFRPGALPTDPLGLFGSTVAGRFAVVRYLGRTSLAHIYRVVHMLMDRPCFLKITDRDAAAPEGIPAGLRREAQVTTTSRHPALLRLLDAGTTGDWAYMTQEWSDGPNLRSVIEQTNTMTVPDLLAIAMQLLDAVCDLHRHGVVLRAFDPERILVPAKGGKPHLRLFDLSRTAYVGEKTSQAELERSKRATGFAVRSTRYMAPDEIREAPADPRSDLYSLGVLLYEMLTGEYPYKPRGQGPGAYVLSHLREEPAAIDAGAREGLPQDLPGILRRMVAKKPEDRFETAEAARRAIEDVIVPDMMRLNTAADRHVLEAWRKRVKTGLGRTLEREAFDEPDAS